MNKNLSNSPKISEEVKDKFRVMQSYLRQAN